MAGHHALEILKQLQTLSLCTSCISYNACIKAFARNGQAREAEEILKSMKDQQQQQQQCEQGTGNSCWGYYPRDVVVYLIQDYYIVVVPILHHMAQVVHCSIVLFVIHMGNI
jgi:pentatricopeptide repeat protein